MKSYLLPLLLVLLDNFILDLSPGGTRSKMIAHAQSGAAGGTGPSGRPGTGTNDGGTQDAASAVNVTGHADVTEPPPSDGDQHPGDKLAPANDAPDVRRNVQYDFTGVQDVVVILDRSASIGYNEFERDGKDFMEAMLRTGYIIHPDHTRLAVITFARDVTTVIDGITGTPFSGCTLFAKKGMWDNVRYDRDEQDGADYKSAFSEARSILSAGRLMRRELTSQTTWLVTDGEYGSDEAALWASYIRDDGIQVFGAGMGFYLNGTKMDSLVSEPPNYYYHKTPEWMDMLQRGFMEKRNVTLGLYEPVDMNLCGICGAAATCYCDSLSDRLPLCACQQHFYPQGNECIECPSGSHKSVWGNRTCSACTDESSLVGGQVPDRCKDQSFPLLIVVVAAVGSVSLIVFCVCIYCCCVKRKSKHPPRNDSSDAEAQNTIYTQTYSTPESTRALVPGASNIRTTRKTVVAATNTAFPPLSPQTSNMSTDSGVSMSVAPHYIDPALDNSYPHTRRMHAATHSSAKLNNSTQRAASNATYASNDYIDVLADSETDSDHEDPQTIQKLSFKYRSKNDDQQNTHSKPQTETLGASGKPRMPSPTLETSGFQRFKNRLSRTFGLSNEYTNAEEIEKLKRQGRASAKISAYQVKNIVDLFEKKEPGFDPQQGETKNGMLGGRFGKANTVPKQGSKITTKPTVNNSVILRVHNNLTKVKSSDNHIGQNLQSKNHHPILSAAVPRPQSTHSMDSDGYMRPTLFPSSHASYIDLIPSTKTSDLNNMNSNVSEGPMDLYSKTLPGSKC